MKVPPWMTVRPTGSTMADTPLFVTRTKYRRCSTVRNFASARWIQGSVVSPNQASLVMFTNRSGSSAATNLLTKLGMISS